MQYEAAYVWLDRMAMLDRLTDPSPANLRVFEQAIGSGGTSWFTDADQLVRTVAELPDDARRAAEALDLDEERAFTHVMATWGKVDTAVRAEVGAAGEAALVALLAHHVAAPIEHVSLISDGLGYDVEVKAIAGSACLEVKSTTRVSRLTVYLSRNEFAVMQRRQEWQMVAVRLSSELQLAAVATIPKAWILAQAPKDRGPFARWESCRLDVPNDVPIPGIPPLNTLLAADAPAVLRGRVPWIDC